MAKIFLENAAEWSSSHTFPENVQQFCAHLEKHYPKAQWALSFSEQQSFSLEVLAQKVEHFEHNMTAQLTIEMFFNHQSASASVLGCVFEDWVSTAEKAWDMAKKAQSDPFLSFPHKELFDLSRQSSHHLAIPYDIRPDRLEQHLMAFEQAALDEHPQIRSDGASLSSSYDRISYANSAGVRMMTPQTTFSQSLSLIAQDNHSQETDYIFDTKRDFTHLKSYKELAAEAVGRTIAKLGKKKIPSGVYPVIFSPRCSIGLIKCLIKALSGRLQYLKSSYLTDALGTAALPAWVSLVDNPLALDRHNYAPIDSDGLPTREHRIIENGIIKEYILSYYAAQRLGLSPNGLASGLINMGLTTNAQSLLELAGQYPRCLVVDSVSGTGINLMHGDYSQGIEGFLYEKGQLVHALEEVTVAANLKELFLSLEGHAADFLNPTGTQIGSVAFPQMAVSCL
jgi:PmbA protein